MRIRCCCPCRNKYDKHLFAVFNGGKWLFDPNLEKVLSYGTAIKRLDKIPAKGTIRDLNGNIILSRAYKGIKPALN